MKWDFSACRLAPFPECSLFFFQKKCKDRNSNPRPLLSCLLQLNSFFSSLRSPCAPASKLSGGLPAGCYETTQLGLPLSPSQAQLAPDRLREPPQGKGRWFVFLFLPRRHQMNASRLNRGLLEFAFKEKTEERKEGGKFPLGSMSPLGEVEVPWAEPLG